MKKIVITGSKGEVGRVLVNKLGSTHEIVEMDLPEGDLRDYKLLREKTKNVAAIIHLAMDPKVGFMNELMNPNDFLIAYNVYKIAKENIIPRVIMFSSIHADDYADWKPGDKPKTTDTIPIPDSPYGLIRFIWKRLEDTMPNRGLKHYVFDLVE